VTGAFVACHDVKLKFRMVLSSHWNVSRGRHIIISYFPKKDDIVKFAYVQNIYDVIKLRVHERDLALHRKDGGNTALRNVGILPYHCTMSQSRRPRLQVCILNGLRIMQRQSHDRHISTVDDSYKKK
jgi:hypothetical protein